MVVRSLVYSSKRWVLPQPPSRCSRSGLSNTLYVLGSEMERTTYSWTLNHFSEPLISNSSWPFRTRNFIQGVKRKTGTENDTYTRTRSKKQKGSKKQTITSVSMDIQSQQNYHISQFGSFREFCPGVCIVCDWQSVLVRYFRVGVEYLLLSLLTFLVSVT